MTADEPEPVLHQQQHNHREHPSMFNFCVKVPAAISITLFMLVAIWYTAPSTLSPTRLSPAQLAAFLSSPVLPEAQRPIRAASQPLLYGAINVTHEFEDPLSVPNNISAYSTTDDGFSQLNSTTLLAGTQPPSFSNVNQLDSETLSAIASRSSDSGSSKYENGPSPPHSSPSTRWDSSAPVHAPTTGFRGAHDKPITDDDLPLDTIASGPAQDPRTNKTKLSSPDSSLEASASLPSTLEDVELGPQQKGQRYMFPMLSSYVGTGNQLMEYKSVAVIARTLNRTLCMVPFFGGPQRHFGYLGSNHYGLHIEDRYDLQELSRFIKLANINECIRECNNGTIDRVWRLRAGRSSDWSWWFPHIPLWAVATFDRQFGKWISATDIEHDLGKLNEEPEAKCVGMGGAFPGLRWRGAMWAASAYMIHTPAIINASDVFQALALGINPYISVHWRFEESNCQGHSLGLCFTRCGDGSLIAGGLKSPRYMELPTVMGSFRGGPGFHGAGLTKEDLAAAVYDRAKEQGVQSVYLSTDGWLRGNESRTNIKWVVEEIRRRGMNVSGLWEIQGLPNFGDGTFAVPKEMPHLFGLAPDHKVSNHMIALVEQEICARSVVFLGSGQSSWSLAVFDARRSRRRRLDLEESIRSNGTRSGQEVDESVIQHLYEDKHAAGPACHGIRGGTAETYEDEAPDGWLDYEACEKRIDLGGKCVRLVSEVTI